jgi:ferredoxin
MITLTIDNRTIDVQPGTMVWEAARQLGIEIPTLCYLDGADHFTSCMVCLVKDNRNGKLLPSCSTPAMQGMNLTTNDAEVHESRRASLELLLSEHVGDCEAPCQLVCPAHMNIPLMNRLIAKGDFAWALEVVKRDIALPSILGRICPAPCEAGCRRKPIDEAVSICLLKRITGDEDRAQNKRYMPKLKSLSGKRVAIIGAGPAGLSAAYYLQQNGHQAVIFDQNERAGGDLMKIDADLLSPDVIDQEVAAITATGVQIHLNETIDNHRFEQFRCEYDAVVVAIGTITEGNPIFGLKTNKQGLVVDKSTYLTSEPHVFAIGNALRASKLAVRSVGQGKEVAEIIDSSFHTGEVVPRPERFNSKFGKLTEPEIQEYLKESVSAQRIKAGPEGFTREQAMAEAARCLHCDCRAPESCKLRLLSDQYGADQRRFQYDERKPARKTISPDGLVYESGKCIKCGICVRLARQHQEEFGFTFIGRGFDVQIGVPFNETLQAAFRKTARLVAKNCPTGALAMSELEEKI